MSQSPIDDFSERTVLRYRQGWKALNRLLHEDRSFSGHERHCAFLNTQGDSGSQRFADISAASGWDFPDDGRAVALSDWDLDGDLDIWVTNRTAPRIRLLRNNSVNRNHFLAIKLRGDGQQTNRDAIGARVEVVLGSDDESRLIKTRSAGEGFLSQSSGWLHFGLGDAEEIRRVIVHWPGGETRTYDGLAVDRRYMIDQQNGQVTSWSPPAERKPLIAAPQTPPKPSSIARTVLPAPRLLPTLRPEGRSESLNAQITGPTVISIWSATCTSCVQELHAYAQQADRLREAGLNVIAINLDNLEGDPQNADRILQGIEFPFSQASGTAELVRSLDVLKRAVFDRWQTLSVPTSFLVDERGFVGVIYQGPVEIDQLLSDLELLQTPLDQRRRDSTPFVGRWIMPPPTADPLQVVTRFIDEAMVANGIDYLERHAQLAETSRNESDSQEPGDLYYVLAIILRDQQQNQESLNAFRKAIEYRPNDFRFRNDFASLLAELGALDEAAEQLLQALRINAQDVSVQRKLAFLRTAQRQYEGAIQWFTRVLEVNPEDVACSYNLANVYRANGQLEQAVKMYRRTLEIQPQMTLAANNLAWILATHPQADLRNGEEAVRWAEQACEQTKYAQPSLLDTLACAYAEAGDYDKAVATATQAIEMLTNQGQTQAAQKIQVRRQQFQSQQPYRD